MPRKASLLVLVLVLKVAMSLGVADDDGYTASSERQVARALATLQESCTTPRQGAGREVKSTQTAELWTAA